MKHIRYAALFAAGALMLSACGGSTEEPEQEAPEQAQDDAGEEGGEALSGHLEIWTDGTKFPAVEKIVEDFMSDYDGITVDLIQKNFSDIGPDFITQVPTGEGPDIVVTPHDNIGNMMHSGVIAPVELGDLADQLNPVAVEAFTYDGQTYGVPYGMENIGMVRNNDLTTDVPATWDDLIESGNAVDGAEFPVVVNVTEDGDPYHMYPLQTSFGSEVFERADDGSYINNLMLGNEEGLEFAEWLGTQGQAGTGVFDPSLTADVAKEAFVDGRAPFFITGPWDGSTFKENDMDVDVLPIPSAGSEPARPFVGVQGFVISANSENKLLANTFLVNYIGSVDGQMELFRHGPGTPALAEAAESEEVTSDPLNAGFAEAGIEGVPMPSIPEIAHTWVLWGQAEAEIIRGAEPDSTWSTMANNVQDAIDAE